MIVELISGPTGTSTKLVEEEAECAEADPLLYARKRRMATARLLAWSFRGSDLSTVRARPCEVVKVSMEPSKTCEVFEVLFEVL